MRRLMMVAAASLAAVGCSGGSDDARSTVATRAATTMVVSTPFCDAAVGFSQYLDEQGALVFEPTLAEGYLDGVDRRLGDMVELAPEAATIDGVAVGDDVATIRDAYRRLDDDLAAVDYDLLLLDNSAFVSEEGSDAAVRLDAYLFDECGFDPLASVPFEGEAPEVLSDDELSEMVEGDDEDEVVSVLAAQFEEEFGLDGEAAGCLAENMDRDSVVAIASGAAVTDDVAADFAATLEQCGLTAGDVGG